MPTRKLPRTDDERSTALTTCLAKYNATAAADRLITAAQFATLNATLSPWNAARTALAPALQAQTAATAAVDAALIASVRVNHCH